MPVLSGSNSDYGPQRAASQGFYESFMRIRCNPCGIEDSRLYRTFDSRLKDLSCLLPEAWLSRLDLAISTDQRYLLRVNQCYSSGRPHSDSSCSVEHSE